MISPFRARHESGMERLLRAGEELCAKYPVEVENGIVHFQQDNQEFEADARTFLAAAQLKSEYQKAVEEDLEQPSFGGAGAPAKCKAVGCGHQKLEHANGRGACRGMNVEGRRQFRCSCQQFKP